MEALELYIFCYVQARIYYNWIPETPSKYVDCSPSYITTLISGIGLKGRGNERERREEEKKKKEHCLSLHLSFFFMHMFHCLSFNLHVDDFWRILFIQEEMSDLASWSSFDARLAYGRVLVHPKE
jgi:hypothetical protein